MFRMDQVGIIMKRACCGAGGRSIVEKVRNTGPFMDDWGITQPSRGVFATGSLNCLMRNEGVFNLLRVNGGPNSKKPLFLVPDSTFSRREAEGIIIEEVSP